MFTYVWNLKNKTNNYNKTETDSQDTENKLVVTRVGWGEWRWKLVKGIKEDKLLGVRQINSKNVMFSMGNVVNIS